MFNKIKGAFIFIISISLVLLVNIVIENKVLSTSSYQKLSDIISTFFQILILIYLFVSQYFKKLYSPIATYILGALLALAFFLKFLGLEIVNPKNINWIMAGGDRVQHFLGWNFYLHDNWYFPSGLFYTWGYPIGMSTIFTDSIPLAAFIFKLFKGILPEPFQFLGLWLMLTYLLLGILSIKLMKRITDQRMIQLLGSALFIMSPIVLHRSGGHTSLTSHWILLWAIYLCIDPKLDAKRIINWTLLHIITVLIHPYLLIMLYIVFLIYIFRLLILDKNINLLRGITGAAVPALAIIISLYLGGFFNIKADTVSVGLGFHSMNLNAFFNPQGNSLLLKDRPLATNGQYEGLNYLGIGILLLIVLCLIDIIKNGITKENKNFNGMFALQFIVLLLAAVSNVVTFDNKILIKIELQDKIIKLWSIVRSTGRMIWPVYYIIIFLSLRRFITRNRSIAIFALSFIVALQFYDLSGFFLNSRTCFYRVKAWENPLKDDFWNKAKEKYPHLSVIDDLQRYEPIAYYASSNNMTMDFGYFARVPKAQENYVVANKNNLLQGKFDKDTFYIINDDVLFEKLKKSPPEGSLIEEIDGYKIFAPNYK